MQYAGGAAALISSLFGSGATNRDGNGASSYDAVGQNITGNTSTNSTSGRNTTTTGARTTTRQGTTNQDAIDATVRSLMEGPSGLASILGGQNAGGTYGNTNAALLTSDLVSRIGGEVGRLTQGTTETQGAQTTENDNSQTTSLDTLIRNFTSASGGQRQFSHAEGGENTGALGGCFLTTAACEIMGLDDDCIELRFLRRFRDEWMQKNHPEMVVLYYHVGDLIVAYIKSRPDAREVFTQIYHDVVQRCVDDILNGKNEAAYKKYAEAMVLLMVAAEIKYNVAAPTAATKD